MGTTKEDWKIYEEGKKMLEKQKQNKEEITDVQNLKDILKWLFEKTFYSFDIARLYEIIDNLNEKSTEYESNKHYIELGKAIKWIPVTERLPQKPENDWVLVKCEFVPEGWSGVPHIAELRNGVWYCQMLDEPMEEELGVKVVAWFPMELIEWAERNGDKQ